MDRWKAEQGRGREKRKIRRKKSRRERVRRKKMQTREKVGKSRNTVFFQWFGAPEGRKVGSLKRRVRSQLARVARSTFRSQNVQSTPASEHFWKLRCRKSARRGGEAHFKVKTYKAHHVRTSFGGSDVEKVHAVAARSTFRSQNVKNTRGSDHFWRFRCRFASLHYTTLHYTTLHYTTLHYNTLHYTTLQLQLHNYTPLHSTTLHYTPLH